MDEDDGPAIDYRFTLANERTFLAWIRTALALVAGGMAVAKALEFHHEALRWVVAVPPIAAGGAIGFDAARRWRSVERAMRMGEELAVGRGLRAVSVGLGTYAVVALVAVILDG
jgi:putative membrane protein